MKVSLIAAMTKNRVIGKDNSIPWRGMLPGDMARFKRLTMNHCVIMGRNTYESIIAVNGQPLQGRTNIVISRLVDYRAPGCYVVKSFGEAIQTANCEFHDENITIDEVMVIGGGEIFRQTMSAADRIYLTIIDTEMEGDTLFPDINPAFWREVSRESIPSDEKNKFPHDFVVFERMRK